MVCHRRAHRPRLLGYGGVVSFRLPPVPIRWLLVKDPDEQFNPQAFLSTDLSLTPQQMLTFFIQRWQVETTFEEARAHLGMETQRQWNDQAIARTTPLLLALFAVVTLLAHRLREKQLCQIRQAAWYRKTKPTFSDALAWVRKYIWQRFSRSRSHPDSQKRDPDIINRLMDIVCYAN